MPEMTEFYETLGFSEIEIEDGLTALYFEISPDGEYFLLTDENGSMPATLKQGVILACYSPQDAFLWSTSFKNAQVFKETWSEGRTAAEKGEAVQKYRENQGYY